MPETPEGALLPCPDCGREVSRRATSCPQCGAPLTKAAEPSRVGTSGNILAAFASFVMPGLGQLLQGTPGRAKWHFFVVMGCYVTPLVALLVLHSTAFAMAFFVTAIILHMRAVYDAATWDPGGPAPPPVSKSPAGAAVDPDAPQQDMSIAQIVGTVAVILATLAYIYLS